MDYSNEKVQGLDVNNSEFEKLLSSLSEEIHRYSSISQDIISVGHKLHNERTPQNDSKSEQEPMKGLMHRFQLEINRLRYINDETSAVSSKLNKLI